MTRTLQVEYMRLDELKEKQWAGNPKTHDLPALITSLRAHGFVAPLILDEGTGKLVAGHGRLSALRALAEKDEPAPDGLLVDDDGTWLAPVITGIAFKNPDEAQSYLLADNRLTELGAWDPEGLLTMLREMEEAELLDATAFTSEDIEDLVATLDAIPTTDPEAFRGGYAETEEEAAARAAAAGTNIPHREVVLLMTLEAYESFQERVDKLRDTWGLTTGAQVVSEAVKRASDAQE